MAKGRGQWPRTLHRELRGLCQQELGYVYGRDEGVPGPEPGTASVPDELIIRANVYLQSAPEMLKEIPHDKRPAIKT